MTIPREQTQAHFDLLAEGALSHTPEQSYTVADRLEEWAARQPDRIFLIDGEQRISFAELNRQVNRYAAVAQRLGLSPGQVGAVMIENRPEFFYAMLGLAKLGCVAALVNTFNRGEPLRHALRITSARLLFLGSECAEQFATAPDLADTVTTVLVPDPENPAEPPAGVQALEPLLATASDANPPASLREGIVGADPMLYAFTSGTTGLPKAAIISHMRWLGVGDGWKNMLGITEEDVFYCMLPLFHGAAGMSLASNALAAGAPIVLRRKFSASGFWEDVRRYGVTATQYIGEICRYLVNQPPRPDDRDHSLRIMTGAGLTREVWQQFIERFGDLRIIEGMGATESNCALSNPDGKIGAVGRVPYPERSNARLVRYDVETDDYLRDEQGFLIECQPGEPGELIGKILEIPGLAAGRFEGYTDPVETEKKILRDVFEPGDRWFATGDLLMRDEEDYYYFVDRIGDTFRWKSENVSTTEVVEALEDYDAAELINVYGVRVPDHEGRVGMAAIQLKPGHRFDAEAFYRLASERLPHYAVPHFLRVSEQADLTPTFKVRKVDLQRQGYSPELVSDPLLVLSPSRETYVPYSEAALAELRLPPFEPGDPL